MTNHELIEHVCESIPGRDIEIGLLQSFGLIVRLYEDSRVLTLSERERLNIIVLNTCRMVTGETQDH